MKKKNKSKYKIIKNFIYFIIYFLLFSFLLFPLWLNKKFGFLYLDQFIFNLKLVYYGYLDGDSNLVNSAIKWLIIFPIFLSLIIIFTKKTIIFFVTYKDKSIDFIIKKLKFIKKNYFKYKIDKFISILRFFLDKAIFILLICLIFILFVTFTNFFKKPDKISSNDFLDLNYEYPNVSSNLNKYNLVILYVESLENTFSDKNIFGENLLKEIWDVKGGQSVKYFYQIPGAGYTLSSLVSTQCGIPMLTLGKSFFDPTRLQGINKFLPNLNCLSDILYEHDYENIFITSDKLENSLTDKFLLSHKYSNLFGLNKLIELGYETSKNAWHSKKSWSGGAHDNILLGAAIDILKNRKKDKKNKNFFMTIMTLDTHSPSGYPNRECLKNFLNKRNFNNYTISESVKCTSIYVSKFINDFNKLELKNTKLVIVGDHLLMGKIEVEDRYIYNKFFIDDKLKIERDDMNYYDLYPSLLEAMNFKINNDLGKVALGYSIFRKNQEYKKIYSMINGSSKLYDKFWGMNDW